MALLFSHPTRRRPSLWARLINSIEDRLPSDRLVLRVLFFAIMIGLVMSLLAINRTYLVSTPVSGGTLIEGIIGIPRFVNPVLAVTRADQDVAALIYSGLMTIDEAGVLVPDLAESVTVSGDGKTYNILLRRDIRFHDETPLTARDVAFTIGLIQNPDLKSPVRGNWAGVTVEELGEYELNVILDEAYTPFIENFTMGIVPRHIWNDLPIEQIPFSARNTEPVGSGPFKIDKVVRNDAGLIDSYKLIRASASVKLAGVTTIFFQNEEDLATAFLAGKITSTASLPPAIASTLTQNNRYVILSEPLPRVFAVFFNQNKSAALRDIAVREALELAIDRTGVVAQALGGYGVPIMTPVPPHVDALHSVRQAKETGTTSPLALAEQRLEKAGWNKSENGTREKRIEGTLTPLQITLRTANIPMFERTTALLAESWRNLGIVVEVEQYEQSDLVQAVIRPRDFEALLFGIDMNRSVDLYPFWHSSQRDDPGFNIAQYANREVDALLSAARTQTDSAERASSSAAAMDIIAREQPVIALYVPALTYVIKSDIALGPIDNISKPHERFMNIETWHMAEENRWPIFQ